MIFTGTIVTYGRGKAAVTTTGPRTEFGKIAEEVAAVEIEKTPLEKRTDEIGKWLGIISLSICLLITIFSIVRQSLVGGVDLPFIVTMIMFAVSLAVAAVPEALAAIVTGALAIGMHQMAKNNALIRKMPAVETLGCTTVICSDKTGTLTKGEMTVRRIHYGGRPVEVTGVGYAPEGEFKGLPPEDRAAGSGWSSCSRRAFLQRFGARGERRPLDDQRRPDRGRAGRRRGQVRPQSDRAPLGEPAHRGDPVQLGEETDDDHPPDVRWTDPGHPQGRARAGSGRVRPDPGRPGEPGAHG